MHAGQTEPDMVGMEQTPLPRNARSWTPMNAITPASLKWGEWYVVLQTGPAIADESGGTGGISINACDSRRYSDKLCPVYDGQIITK
jgi:hypothetical protein